MIAKHIHDALGQVRKLQSLILEKRNFRGYSGGTRTTGGLLALAAAYILSSHMVAHDITTNIIGWSIVLFLSAVLNYSALFIWFWFGDEAKRDWKKLLPAIDAVPALAVGAVFSAAFLIQGHFELLFGTWMCLYGLSHLAYRQTLPKENYVIGIYYIVLGTFCLFKLFPFTNPWPMGVVFGVGEIAGGYVFYLNRRKS